MVLELEGLISHLLTVISCAGEQGCSIFDIVDEIQHSSEVSGPRSRNFSEPLSDHGVATIWNWLVSVNDVSVGLQREFNQVPLSDLLAMNAASSKSEQGDGNVNKEHPRPFIQQSTVSNISNISNSSTPPQSIRVHVSEDTMWETITGHSVNYKRVPRLEWLLLLGIASTKSEGILQGDLGRLVEQDKRSVPKRTDVLVKKGYIVKRTTLVRGTKTSKLWLKSFAPPLPKEGEDQNQENEEEINLSYQTLAANLDQVPWHTRWTGDSMDFHALATTIMAVAKQWQVIRLQDLKAKLGVLGMRWQMKIVSKICRFLNSRGAIQYVAAKLETKVFKDCIKFNKDLSPKDWSAFLATGKRSAKPLKTALLGIAERADPDLQADLSHVNGAKLGQCPPWTIDDPLPQKITRAARSFGAVGVTNPEIYVLTLGPSFNRFISSLTSFMATSNVQPPRLQHLQLKSEHIRVGKVASYRFFTPQPLSTPETGVASQGASGVKGGSVTSPAESYGFSLHCAEPKFAGTNSGLQDICGISKKQRMRQKEPKRKGRPKNQRLETPPEPSEPPEPDGPEEPEERARPSTPDRLPQPSDETLAGRKKNLSVTLRVSREALRKLLFGSHVGTRSSSVRRSEVKPRPKSIAGTRLDHIGDDDAFPTSTCNDSTQNSSRAGAAGRAVGRGRGRGRGGRRGGGHSRSSPSKKPKVEGSWSRPWTCEACGGSWKNDIGLKYHLEKSKTSCNPDYVPVERGPGHLGRRSTFYNSKTAEDASDDLTDQPRTSSVGPREGRGKRKDPEASLHATRSPEIAERGTDSEARPTQPSPLRAHSSPKAPPAVTTVKALKRVTNDSQKPFRFSKTNLDQGLLSLEPAAAQDGRESYTKGGPDPSSQHVDDSLHEVPVGNNSALLDDAVHRSATNARSLNSKHRIGDANLRRLIEKLLDRQGGVVLGGKLLFNTILGMWNEEFSAQKQSVPTKKQFQTTISRLLKEGVITESWHAFRDATSSFSKCQLLLLPGHDPFSAEATRLVETVKESQMAASATDGCRPSVAGEANSSEAKIGVRGRRLLADEVAVLHAPVYAARIAAQKEAETEDRDRVKKRSMRSEGGALLQRDDSLTPAKRRKTSKITPLGLRSRANGGQSAAFRELRMTASPARRVRFLEPNTCLEQDGPSETNIFEEHDASASQDTSDGGDVEIAAGVSPIASPIASPDVSRKGDFADMTTLSGRNGIWPWLDAQYFERARGSFKMQGWMPDADWFVWEGFPQALEKRQASLVSLKGRQRRQRTAEDIATEDTASSSYRGHISQVQACFELEMAYRPPSSSTTEPAVRSAGPHNIFVNLGGTEAVRLQPSSQDARQLKWPKSGQMTQTSLGLNRVALDKEDASSSSDDGLDLRFPVRAGHGQLRSLRRAKNAAQRSRTLTPSANVSLADSMDNDEDEDVGFFEDPMGTPDELLAACIAVSALMGGLEKAGDWELLLVIFPGAKLGQVRKFWQDAQKTQSSYIQGCTRAFQQNLMAAFEQEELARIDVENPRNYDWRSLIQWTLRLPPQAEFRLPASRDVLDRQFRLVDVEDSTDDWRERFFHSQASVFSRFEAATSKPAALAVRQQDLRRLNDRSRPKYKHKHKHKHDHEYELRIVKSWIKALCGTGTTEYSAETIRDKLWTLSPRNEGVAEQLWKEAIDQLTRERIICRSKRPPLGGRPYRLNEGYLSALGRMAQRAKYDAAARFKSELDAAFRTRGSLTVPYTLSDGTMMALTNLSGAGRIRLVATNVPDIPFGFEPGNYESRKYPKSYLHFGIEAVPEDTYLFDDEIAVLAAARDTSPPVSGPRGELPQWVDILGAPDAARWSDVLGAFCFVTATRGTMDVPGICSALSPVLDEFEARLILDWGRQTGVLGKVTGGMGSLVGEWWWLAVPWARKRA